MPVIENICGICDIENVSACDEGLKLAVDFLQSCRHAIERVGLEQTIMLRADFHFQFSRYAAHYEGCDKCNEG